jgi:hypothetical protein
MLKSGVWPVIRQRPFSVVAKPGDNPKTIFIAAFDTNPLAPDYNYVIEGQAKAFQTGVDALLKLTDGKVHLNVSGDKASSSVFLETKGVQINQFTGPHIEKDGFTGFYDSQVTVITEGDFHEFLGWALKNTRPGEKLEFRSGGYVQIDVPKCEVDYRKDILIGKEYTDEWDKYKVWDLKMKNPEPVFRFLRTFSPQYLRWQHL